MTPRAYNFPWKFEGIAYRDHYLMSQVSENDVQKAILELLHSYNVDAVAIDAGGRRQRGRMISAAKAAGISLAGVQNAKTGAAIPKGFADLEGTLAPGGRSLYIEVKAPAWIDEKRRVIRAAGQPTVDQLTFLALKQRRGALVMVAWSAADVEQYMGADLRTNRRCLA